MQDRDGRALVHCHAGCDQTAVVAALRKAGVWGRDTTRREWPIAAHPVPTGEGSRGKAPFDASAVLSIWQQCRDARGTVVETYLRSRCIHLPIPVDIRLYLRMRHLPTGMKWPAMVAAVRDAGGTIVALHRTYLRPDGMGKADIDPAKMTLGPVGGCSVHLAPAGPHMIVAEGIESALSAMGGAGLPTWAALSAGGVRKLILPPLPSASTVTIAADNDPVGLDAAHDAAQRWITEGRTVRIATPPAPYTDWNDAATGKAVDHE
ncbi:DUF7146 domain-containing protein [Niveispirillum cyanobacteriorum]|nr:toprim domain-containing protein [Niveispirillum cyanobacteriorum]